VIGIVTADIGIALLVVGALLATPVILGISAGFMIFGLGCFAYGYYKERT